MSEAGPAMKAGLLPPQAHSRRELSVQADSTNPASQSAPHQTHVRKNRSRLATAPAWLLPHVPLAAMVGTALPGVCLSC